MMRKNSNDDEIPLTESRSTILQETKARFDTLLKAARSQDDDEVWFISGSKLYRACP